MRYYAETIPAELTEKLKGVGFPEGLYINGVKIHFGNCFTFGEVFSWLIEKGWHIYITPAIDPEDYRGEAVARWDGWLNAHRVVTGASWNRAAICTVESAIIEISKL